MPCMNKVIKLWEGFNSDIQEGLYTQRYHKEVNSWAEVVTMAESLELGLNEAKQERSRCEHEEACEKQKNTFKEYRQNQRANNRRTDDNLERHKFSSTPRNKQDYKPTLARKTGDEIAKELFSISKGPTVKWEPNNRAKPSKPK